MLKRDEEFDLLVTKIYNSMRFEPNPDWRLSELAFQPEGYLIALCTQGRVSYTLEGKNYLLQQGDLMFIRRSTLRTACNDQSNPWGFYCVIFELDANEAGRELIPALLGISHLNYLTLKPVFREIHHLWITKRTGYVLRVRSLVEKVLIEIITNYFADGEDRAISPQMEEILYRVEHDLRQEFSIPDLARQCGMSEGCFRRKFKAYTGMPFGQYQQFVRISLAKTYLLYGNNNIQETANLTGFSNEFYFSRVFKKITGVSPSEYVKGGGQKND